MDVDPPRLRRTAVNVGGPRCGLEWQTLDGQPDRYFDWPVPPGESAFVHESEYPYGEFPDLPRDRYELLYGPGGKPSIDDAGRYRYRYVGRR